jgi:hypothetical protein
MPSELEPESQRFIIPQKLIPVDFLDGIKLSDEESKQVNAIKTSKILRILAFSQVQQVFKRKVPHDVNEAAARYYEAKGLMDLIPEIQK